IDPSGAGMSACRRIDHCTRVIAPSAGDRMVRWVDLDGYATEADSKEAVDDAGRRRTQGKSMPRGTPRAWPAKRRSRSHSRSRRINAAISRLRPFINNAAAELSGGDAMLADDL